MIPTIAKVLNDLQNRLDDMSDTELEGIIKAGDNTIVELTHVAETLSAFASVLGDEDSTKPGDYELSCILFSAAHTLNNVRAMLDLAAEAEYQKAKRQTQKSPA